MNNGAPINAVMAPTGNSRGAIIVRATVSATITKSAPPSAAAGILIRLSLPSESLARCGTTSPTYPTDPLAATELPTNKLATRNTTIRTRPTSTPRSKASRSPSINKFNDLALSVNASAPATAITIATGNSVLLAPDKSPSSQNVNDRILVASIKTVTKTITDERKVVTITPASINRSGVAPARPRASWYTANVATRAPLNASTGRVHSFAPKNTSAIIVPTAAPFEMPSRYGSASGFLNSA